MRTDSDFNLEEVKMMELEILKFIRKICDDAGLRYFLTYGTLIGAVRHKGFIPWDDDIDIFMPRDDYNKFVEIMQSAKHDPFELMSFETNTEFTAPLAKVINNTTVLIQQYDYIEKVPLGVYVDIFVIDGAGDDYQAAIDFYNREFQVYTDWRKADLPLFSKDKGKIYCLLRFIKNANQKVHGIRYYLAKMKKTNAQYSYNQSKYITCLQTGTKPAERNIWPAEWFGDGVMMQFEDSEFRVPFNYDAVLKKEYGDYMTLPPEEDRISNHEYVLYRK